MFETLALFRFPLSMLHLIRSYVSMYTLAILWNGKRTDSFIPYRGLRYGDHLLTYLFTLYLEMLSMLVNEAVETNKWGMFAICQGRLKIPQLLFAND